MAENEKTVEQRNTVKIHYTGTLDDGNVFDSSEGREPLQFTVGEGRVIKGFENAIVGMKVDEEKTISLEPSEAYGERNDKMQQEVPLNTLKFKEEPKPGMMLTLKDPNGNVVQAFITKIENEKATIDLNHPLAGKKLNFKIKVVEIR